MYNFLKLLFILCINLFIFYKVLGYLEGINNQTVFKYRGRKALLAFNFIGTVIHELSHAIMCLIFLHNITDIKFFSTNTGVEVGYVKHNYNKNNIYQLLGNFFIGIAPLLSGIVIMYIIIIKFSDVNLISKINLTHHSYIEIITSNVLSIIKSIFDINNIFAIRNILIICLIQITSSNFIPSKIDIDSAKEGFILFISICIFCLFIGVMASCSFYTIDILLLKVIIILNVVFTLASITFIVSYLVLNMSLLIISKL